MKKIKSFHNFDTDYDVVIIGGGISGLYCGYELVDDNLDFIILEKESELGGRLKMDTIDSVKIPTGAGYILGGDKKLEELTSQLGIRLNFKKLKMDYIQKESNILKMISQLKSNLDSFRRDKLTFSQYGKRVLGKQWEDFLYMQGYTDFEGADFIDTVENYGLLDNTSGNLMCNFDWDKMVNKLVRGVGKGRIKTGTEVKSIRREDDYFVIGYNGGKLTTKKVVLATTVNVVKDLIGGSIWNGVKSQNFIKIFAKCTGLEEVKTYTVLPSPLKKIIPYGDGVYCIGFSDNDDARLLKDWTKRDIQKELGKYFGDVKIGEMKKYFWDEGTHYYKPLGKEWESRGEFIKKAQNPQPGIWVIGEMVAKKQGWVEGALGSVKRVLKGIKSK